MKSQLIRFVAEFIGENNTFGGEVSEISNGTCL